MTTRLQRWMAPRVAGWYPHEATILAVTAGAADTLNVPTQAWAAVAGDPVPVYLQRSSGREVVTGPGQIVVADYLIFAAPVPPFTSANRLRIGGVDYELFDFDPLTGTRSGATHSETLARALPQPLVG